MTKLMRLTPFLLMIVIGSLSIQTHARPAALQATVSTLTGKHFTINDLRQKQALYVKVWASWCSSCMEQMPHFNKIHQEYGDALKILSINLSLNETPSAIKHVIEKHKLQMPTYLDDKGQLVHALQLPATPMHALFDADGNLVHLGHEASQALDEKLSLIANGAFPSNSAIAKSAQAPKPLDTIPHLQKTISNPGQNFVLLTSTWCHWYLKERRPNMAQNCETAINVFNNRLAGKSVQNAAIIVSNLWTQEKEMNEFRDKFNIKTPIAIDPTNDAFYQLNVQQFPTLVVFKNGHEVFRTSDFSHPEQLVNQVEKL